MTDHEKTLLTIRFFQDNPDCLNDSPEEVEPKLNEYFELYHQEMNDWHDEHPDARDSDPTNGYGYYSSERFAF